MFALIYFIIIISWIILLYILTPLLAYSDLMVTLKSGFVSYNTFNFGFLSIILLFLTPAFFIKPLRKMFVKLPWLKNFLTIMTTNFVILVVFFTILNKGYEVRNTKHHVIGLSVAVIVFIILRICMGKYYTIRGTIDEKIE